MRATGTDFPASPLVRLARQNRHAPQATYGRGLNKSSLEKNRQSQILLFDISNNLLRRRIDYISRIFW